MIHNEIKLLNVVIFVTFLYDAKNGVVQPHRAAQLGFRRGDAQSELARSRKEHSPPEKKQVSIEILEAAA